MTTLKITQFGGQVPRVSPRALPAGAAQRYENLLATSTELRPLPGDKTVAAGLAGARTLYRLGRTPAGTLRTGDTDGWLSDVDDKSYVKGQLNDDATERTVVTWNDGAQPPRVIDATGADRLLGVPAPPKLTLTANVTDEFTRDEALAWVDEELVPAIAEALRTSLVEARADGTTPVAGSYSLFGKPVVASEPWLVRWGPGAEGTLELLPYWGRVTSLPSLEAKLRLIEHPGTGEQAFTDAQLTKLAAGLASLFDPEGSSIKAKRDELDSIGKEFDSIYSQASTAVPPRPVEPTKPTTPEYNRGSYDPGGG